MAAGNVLGLIFELDTESSRAVANTEETARKLGSAVEAGSVSMRRGGEAIDRTLLSNRESARLLSEEFGLRLPRAITSAISRVEALQTVMAAAGTFALAFFAGKELGRGLEALQGWLDRIEGIQRVAKDTFRESLDASLKQINVNDKILEQLTGRNLALEVEGAKQYRIMVETSELAAKIADKEHQQLEIISRLPAIWELIVPPAGMVYKTARDLYDMLVKNRDISLDLAHAQQKAADAAVETATRMLKAEREQGEQHRRNIERAEEAAKHAAAEEARRAKQEEEFIVRITEEGDRSTKRMQKWHEDWARSIGLPEAVKFSLAEINRAINQSGLAAAMALPPVNALGGGFHQLTEAQRQALPLTLNLDSAIARMTEREREQTAEMLSGQLPAMRRLELEQQRQLDQAQREIRVMHERVLQHKATRAQEEALEVQYTQLVAAQAARRKATLQQDSMTFAQFAGQVRDSFGQVAGATTQAGIAAAIYGQSMGKAMEQAAKATLASIAGQMGVKALEAAAYGAYYLAAYIGSWGTDAAALAASEAYFASAAEFGAIAGVAGAAGAAIPAGGGAYGAGAGSSRYGASAGSAAGGGYGEGGGGRTPAYPGAGPQSQSAGQTIHLEFNGGAICPHCAQDIAARLTQGVKTGTITSLVSTESFKTTGRS